MTKHLIDQLRVCNKLKVLVLSRLDLPDDLGEIIASLTSLEHVELNGRLEKSSGCILAGLSHSHRLKTLNIHCFTLSGQISCLFGNQDHPGFMQLEEMHMKESKLGKVDLQNICSAVNNDKLPLLGSLDLSGNVLTDCLSDLVGGSRFLSLTHLNLSNTKLSKEDMDCFAAAVKYFRLPIIESVDLSHNILTDIMSTLVGRTDHPGFRSLIRLQVTNCELSTRDVKCAMAALRPW